MTELLTAAQMRAIEEAAIESGEVTGLELMERAGRGVVEAVFEEWPELAQAPDRAVVLCGPGNNGGDGFVVARRLRDKGWEVEVLFFGSADKLSPDARKNRDVWAAMGAIRPLTVERAGTGKRPALMVDAMFGTGLSRAIPLELANAHHMVRKRDVGDAHPWLVPCHAVAVDCPSGLDCDSGHFLLPERPEETGDDDADFKKWRAWWQGDASRRLLRTDLTVAFHRNKIGHAFNENCGTVRVIDIGLGAEDTHPAHLKAPRTPDRVIELNFPDPNGRSRRILLKKSATLKSSQIFGTTFLHFTNWQTLFARRSFYGRIFCRFASSSHRTDFFNTIGESGPGLTWTKERALGGTNTITVMR